MPSVWYSVWKRSVEECLSRLAGVFSSTPGLLSCGRQWCKRAVAAFRSVQYTRQTRPPTELRGWSNQPSCAVPVEPDARRRACPCSTEARRRNPDRGFWLCIPESVVQSNPDVLSDSVSLREWGRCGKTSIVWSRTSCAEVGVQPQEAANPPTGLGPACYGRFVQRVPAWGAFRLVTAEAGPDRVRVSREKTGT